MKPSYSNVCAKSADLNLPLWYRPTLQINLQQSHSLNLAQFSLERRVLTFSVRYSLENTDAHPFSSAPQNTLLLLATLERHLKKGPEYKDYTP